MIRISLKGNLKNAKATISSIMGDFAKSYAKKSEELLNEQLKKPIIYDGDISDLSASSEVEGRKGRVIASGRSIAFVEFGAGTVTYGSDIHPKADELGMKRGEFGKGKGKQKGWMFPGNDLVSLGTPHSYVTRRGATMVFTRGNPPNYLLWNTAKEMQEKDFIRSCINDRY